MLVCVQYEVDSATEVIQHTDVESFQPRNVADFDASQLYDVWWRGNESTDGGYYKAKVLHMTATQHTSEQADKLGNVYDGDGSSTTSVSHATSGMLVPRQQNFPRSLPVASRKASLPTESQDLLLCSSPAFEEPDDFASQDLLCSSPVFEEPDDFALFRIYRGSGASQVEQQKRIKDVRKHLAQKLGDLRRKLKL
ncbi:hypothetical protein HPB50_028433 [Hyalomma asiaticum]|nr:hypothetical protein HPB50_028433 [Hyalomma asiaticum]